MPNTFDLLKAQHGVITRAQARANGLSDRKVAALIEAGAWRRMHPGVFALTTSVAGPEQNISAAYQAVGKGGIASHRSAAWLWGLSRDTPTAAELIVPRDLRPRLAGVHLHHPRESDGPGVVMRSGLPTTNPLRTLVDLASVAKPRELDDAVDQALAKRLVTVEGIEAELGRRGRQGRKGIGLLRERIQSRGLVGAPGPSVLESRTLRFLARIGATPESTEVVLFGGLYRIDAVLVSPILALEVDGYSYHFSPEAKAADERRRRRIRRSGMELLVYGWHEIMYQQTLLAREILAEIALAREKLRRQAG